MRFLAILLLIITTAPVGDAQASFPSLPPDNLGLAVLITVKDGNRTDSRVIGTGSGFYVEDGKAFMLVTARHVLYDPNTGALRGPVVELLSYSKDETDPIPYSYSLDLATLGPNVKAHPTQDVAVVKFATIVLTAPKAGEMRTLAGVSAQMRPSSSAQSLITAHLPDVRKFNDVAVGNDVLILGYPTSIGLQQFPQIDPRRPLLRKGIIAGKNYQKRSLILDCPSYQGNSGGPVLQYIPRGLGNFEIEVSGVVVELVPFADIELHPQMNYQKATLLNSGYSIAVPMDYVLELITQFDTGPTSPPN
jgi:Trypsin-like peptidase domain